MPLRYGILTEQLEPFTKSALAEQFGSALLALPKTENIAFASLVG